ncbi:MAG: hypothetical protein E7365_03135 [Clostridiales bacterium]|nr:hypothetical protein [Clostridiales bacterium]
MAKKQEKGGSVFLSVILIMLIIALVSALFYVLNMVGVPLPFVQRVKNSNFEKALTSNNYQAAYTIYDKSDNKTTEDEALINHLNGYFELCFLAEYNDDTWPQYRGIEIFNDVIKPTVLNKLDETVLAYYNGEYSEDDVKVYLSRLAKFSFCKEKLVDCVDEVESKDASDKAYNKGVELYATGEYEKAVIEFKKVSSSDANRYPKATEGIERCKQEWGSKKLQEAQKMIDAYNKEGATAILEEMIELFGEYEEAQKMLKSIEPELEY